jgi:hypothetical protein
MLSHEDHRPAVHARIAAFEADDFNTVTLLVSDKQDYSFGQRLPKRSTCSAIGQSDEICGAIVRRAKIAAINQTFGRPAATVGRLARGESDPGRVTLAPLPGY